MAHYISAAGTEFFQLIATYLPAEEREIVCEAFELARREHGDERRRSGELFFTHPLTVAYYLATYGLDTATLVAALLHDVAEDTRISIAEIREQFGPEVSQLVDGLTKFEAMTDDPQHRQSATLQKLFAVMTHDVRVAIIKIFDRLHNMRTIKWTPPDSQRRKARETLDVYAPLANRLGIWTVKNELESLSLEVLNHPAYERITQKLQQLTLRQQAEYGRASHELATHLTAAGIQVIDIFPCPENTYTIYQQSYNNGYGNNYRLDETLRLVVVVKDIDTCYLALRQTHQLWRPVPQAFDDYIAAPRDNLYQSLHTTVIHRKRQHLKVRLRTATMNTLSEIGVLARWLGANMPARPADIDMGEIDRHVEELIDSIRQNMDLEAHDPNLDFQDLMEDVFRNQIMVFTPKGDVRQLPQNATPLDFAYTIHTEVGAQCRSAIVNGQPVPLNRPLREGDRVHIIKRGYAPQRVWLDENLGYLTMNRAKTQARRWFRRLPAEVAIKDGRRLLNYELRMLGLSHRSHQEVADLFGYKHADELYYALGRAELLPTVLAARVLVDRWNQGPSRSVGVPVRSEEGEKFVITNAGGRSVRLCRTCRPRPGDDIVGFVRANRGLTVHRENCHTIPNDPFADRTLKLGWGEEEMREVRLVTIQIDVFDRAGLLFEIAELIGSENSNMPEVHAQSGEGEATIRLVVEVASPQQLVRILHRIHALVNVFSVTCLDMP